MTHATGEDEEMEHGVHVLLLVQGIEHGTRNVTHALGNEPDDGCCRHGVHQGLESHEYTEAHAHETEGLEVGMLFQMDKADNGSCDGTSPDKDKEAPTPIALFAECHEGEGRVGTGDVPVDGSVVPLTQALFPLRVVFDGMVDSGGYITTQHTEEVKDNACARPVVVALEASADINCAPFEFQNLR